MKTRPAIAYTITGRAQTNQIVCRFLHPDYTVGPGVSPGQHSLGVVAGCTASGESHPALKRTFFAEYNAAGLSCQALLCIFLTSDKSITKFNKFSPDFLCILAQHKQAVKFCFLAASFIRSVLPILSSRPAFPAMRSLSYIMVTLLFVMRSAPVPAGIGGTWSPHSYTRESSGGSC